MRRERAGIYRLFVEALELQEELREQFLAAECRGDPQARAEVEELLRFAIDDTAATQSLLPLPPAQPVEDLLGRDYGRFRLVELIGAGGMGVVYRAERSDGVRQSVAIKLASRTVAAAAQVRFESEAQMLARLEHAAVARLIDAGIENGRAWIAMEFVNGVRIDQFCRDRGLATRQVIELIVQLADAVSAAHRLLVVHSDIKPANVLVTPEGSPKLIDFGIATAMRAAREDELALNVESPVLRGFTPGFAAPEQIGGEGVTAATDVFGLGALAYHLLTGNPPHAADGDAAAYARAVLGGEVPAASDAAAAAGASPALVRSLRGDLDAIFAKALARDPLQRYASAADLRAELSRYLERRPVRARQAGALYRFGKFTRRNSWACALSALLLTSVIVGSAVMAVQIHREALARNMAARRDEFLESLLKSADPRGGRRDISVADMLEKASAELDQKLAAEPLVEASMLGVIAQTYGGLGRYADGLAASDRQLALLRGSGAAGAELGHAMASRAELLREQGKWQAAQPVIEEAVALLRSAGISAELCAAWQLLGVVQMHVNQERQALQTFRQVIEVESHGGQSLQRLLVDPYQGLSVTLANLGRYAEALPYAHEAVTVAHRYLAPEHPDALGADLTYADSLLNLQRAAEAEPMFLQIIATQSRVLGADHKDTLLTKLMFSEDLMALHRDAEAADLALSTAQRLEALLGADNMYALLAWSNYASALCSTERADPGLQVLYRVRDGWQGKRPAGDRFLYATGLAIGVCLKRAQRYAEAETALLDAVSGLESARGPSYRRTQQAYGALRDLYAVTDRPRQAALWGDKLNP